MSLAAHELRTPVTVLARYADLLMKQAGKHKGPALDPRLQEKLQAMKEAAHHLAKLTEDVLDATRVQAGQFQLHPSSTDLIALTRRIIDQLQATTERHHLSLLSSLPYLQASIDASRIEQVVSNLLANAIKYSPQGGPIEVTIWRDEQKLEAQVSVCDHGMGIPQGEQASALFIFWPKP
ncbi:MAG TPA: ATP-binding protein [Ktedonobacteraceae bacterium]